MSMLFHGIDFLRVVLKINNFATLGLAVRTGFCSSIGQLCGILFRVDF